MLEALQYLLGALSVPQGLELVWCYLQVYLYASSLLEGISLVLVGLQIHEGNFGPNQKGTYNWLQLCM